MLAFASNFARFAGPNNPLLDLCNYLHSEVGLELSVVTHAGKFDSDFLRHVEFPILPILRGSSSFSANRLAVAISNTRLIRRIMKRSIDSREEIFVNSSIDTLFEVSWAARRKVAVGYNVLFNQKSSILYGFLDRVAVLSTVGKIAAHTNFQKRMYMWLGIPEEKITVIPHCISLKRITRSISEGSKGAVADSMGKQTIFFGGRLVREKGLMELLECYEHLCKSFPVSLVICGDGPERSKVEVRKEMIEQRRKEAKIMLAPHQSHSKFLSMMANSTIVVVPSRWEAFGLILLEAMSLGKPVVATTSGGPSEIITNRVNGVLVRPESPIALEAALRELLEEPERREAIGHRGLETVRAEYEVSKVGPRFAKFLEADV